VKLRLRTCCITQAPIDWGVQPACGVRKLGPPADSRVSAISGQGVPLAGAGDGLIASAIGGYIRTDSVLAPELPDA
jgi:hypothetical protein